MVDNHFDRCTTPSPELFCFVFLSALCISITLSNQSYTKILHDPPASTSQNQNFRVCLPGCCSKLMLRELCLWNSDSGTSSGTHSGECFVSVDIGVYVPWYSFQTGRPHKSRHSPSYPNVVFSPISTPPQVVRHASQLLVLNPQATDT